MFDAVKYKISKLRSLIGVRDKFLQYADWFKYCSTSSFSMNQECFPMYFSSAPPWSGNEKMICNIRSKLFPVGKKTRQEQCWAMTIYLFSTFFPIRNHTVFLQWWQQFPEVQMHKKPELIVYKLEFDI